MKHLAISFFLAGLLSIGIGCKKDINDISKSLQGLWELRKASGMITINYPPGSGNTIQFTGNHYIMKENGQVTGSGDFSVVQDPSVGTETCLVVPAGLYSDRIIYENNFANRKIFMELSGDSLAFISGCFALDGGSVTQYVKQ